ncbi:MAG: hypothetical protein JRH16_18245 [Deltaproteobacteria bacterium]|nr:hypothetical protein [Deltaproteobacteria bacterium]MBW2362719.1 hypothetical protein [Deltaproteobacteria bacterium]
MVRIFLQEAGGVFAAQPLVDERYRVSCARGTGANAAHLSIVPDRGGRPARRGALLLRATSGGTEAASSEPSWLLLAGAGSRLQVNGEPRALGAAMLRHRDEIRLDAAPPLYFSTERLASVELYAGDDEPSCPRCAQAISAGQACVACPRCSIRHHQMPERPCWTYSSCCVLCEQPTELDAGLRWTPEEL